MPDPDRSAHGVSDRAWCSGFGRERDGSCHGIGRLGVVEPIDSLRQQHERQSPRERGKDRAAASVAHHCRDTRQQAVERDESLDAHLPGVDVE